MAGNVQPGVRSGEINTSCLPTEQPLGTSTGRPAAATACRRSTAGLGSGAKWTSETSGEERGAVKPCRREEGQRRGALLPRAYTVEEQKCVCGGGGVYADDEV